MGAIASQITSLTIVYSIVYSDADQRKHQSPESLAFVREIQRGPVNPAQMASNAENVSIWWRHHVDIALDIISYYKGRDIYYEFLAFQRSSIYSIVSYGLQGPFY